MAQGGGLYKALSRYRKVRGLDRRRMERKPGRVVRQDQVRKELSGRLPSKHRLRDYVADYRIPQRSGAPEEPVAHIPERPGMMGRRLSGFYDRPEQGQRPGRLSAGRPASNMRKAAPELTALGQSGINRVAGSARKGRQFQVAYDPEAERYVHQYGQGPNARQVYLDEDNPYSDMYEQEFGRSTLGEMLTGGGSGGARAPSGGALASAAVYDEPTAGNQNRQAYRNVARHKREMARQRRRDLLQWQQRRMGHKASPV